MRRVATLVLAAGFARAPNGQPAEAPPAPPPPQGPAAQVWLTTGDGSKLLSREADVHFDSGIPPATLLRIAVDEGTTYQEIVGFGAAITDASAWLIQNKLAPAQRKALLQELFGRNPGLGLSFTRLTMGASDFSLHQYSYDDMPAGQTDSSLVHFSIDSNRAYVLPTLQRALAINPQLKIMASPWSPPGWMKTTGSLIQGTLLPEAYGPLAEYFGRYIEAYRAEGVPIYAITVQNEPHYEPANYPGMRLEPPARARFVGQYLGPLFARSGIGTIILDWDHNWDEYQSPLQVLADTAAPRYIAASRGTAMAGTSPRRPWCTMPTRTRTPISPSARAGSGRRISRTISSGSWARSSSMRRATGRRGYSSGISPWTRIMGRIRAAAVTAAGWSRSTRLPVP